MKRLQVAVWCGLAVVLAPAQDFVITDLQPDGAFAWTAPPGAICSVEWAGPLPGESGWQTDWVSFQDIAATGGIHSVQLPVHFRVAVWTNTGDFQLVTPYLCESDIGYADGYSPTTNAPWNMVHNGVDFGNPARPAVPFRAAASGTVTAVTLWQNGDIWQVNVMVELREGLVYEYAFIPMTSNPADGEAQLAAIVVAPGQAVAAGDPIGSLYWADTYSIVHFCLFEEWTPICPEPYFTPEARASILRLLNNRWPGAQICY